ncbi:hypothetical protein DSM3645_14550 [Blastopirellula marina DSM 3645]|uniref:DUF4365 domain-containing protein n=2 Tax=Blastopirellula marina TaxID=124 RepID=A3ZSB4_9BACT|nr:hypothetical protein DSM3645_14550 [Blastopirellula marina DSM 3645]
MVPDYGIDGSVEIFEEKGEATGNQFLVQLKASETWGNKRRLALKRSTFDYLVEQPHPCIIVIYDATTKEIRYQWLEGVPSYTINVSDRFVSLPIKHFELFKDVSARIEHELVLLRQLTNGQYRLPIGLRVEIAPNATPDFRYLTAAEVVVKRSRGLLRLASEKYKGVAACIRVGEDGIIFQLSIRYHVTGILDDSESMEELAESILVGIMLLLVAAQRFDLLNNFAQVFGGCPWLHSNRQYMFFVGTVLCTNGCALAGFRILVGLIESDCTTDEIRQVRVGISDALAEPIAVSFACNLLVQFRDSGSFSSDCASEFDWLLAVLHFQLDLRESYRLYRKALRGQSAFRQDPKFWFELAQCQLQLGRYSSAKRSFLFGHFLEPSNDLLYGAGVAAFSVGELTSAEKLFLEAGHGGMRGITRLKLLAIRIIRRYTRADKVDRFSEKAYELLIPHSGTLVPKDACSEVLNLDPLNAIAWRNMGIHNANEGNIKIAAEMVLVAASLARDEGRYWAEAHFLVVSLGKTRLALQILYAGFWVKGAAFAADIREVAEKELQMPPVPLEFLNDMMARGSSEHQHANDQADRRYSSWLKQVNNRG